MFEDTDFSLSAKLPTTMRKRRIAAITEWKLIYPWFCVERELTIGINLGGLDEGLAAVAEITRRSEDSEIGGSLIDLDAAKIRYEALRIVRRCSPEKV